MSWYPGERLVVFRSSTISWISARGSIDSYGELIAVLSRKLFRDERSHGRGRGSINSIKWGNRAAPSQTSVESCSHAMAGHRPSRGFLSRCYTGGGFGDPSRNFHLHRHLHRHLRAHSRLLRSLRETTESRTRRMRGHKPSRIPPPLCLPMGFD